ncbi:hypothetical protein KKC91_03945 [bacterium]|nr:hypothetical protein [bacterium]
MNKKKRLLICTIGICLSLVFSISLFAYEKETHKKITEKAVENVKPKISNVLTNEWKLEEGTNFSFRIIKRKSGNYSQLITQGSWEEDVPKTNCPNHFYDPTTGNGLLGFTDAMSRGVDSAGTSWSYSDSKTYLYNALTSVKKKDRLANFGRMFYSLGRTIHLLEDMAVPAHVRNDAHLPTPAQKDLYEDWTNEAAKNGILPTSGYGAVAISDDDIKDLWDETRDYGEAGDNTYIGMGLSEYTNRYFFSKDTIFLDYSYPAPFECLKKKETIIAEDGGYDVVRYFYTARVNPICKETLFYKYVEDDPTLHLLEKVSYQLDGNCHKAYADKLVPRSVGYSAGLLDHFFRGKLEVTKKEAKRTSETQPIYDVTLKIKNDSGEAMIGGSFVLMYKARENDVLLEDTYKKLGEISLSELLETGVTELPNGAETKEWVINGANGNGVEILMPQDYADEKFEGIEFTLAYSGGLGQESGVTIGKVFDKMDEIPPYYFHVQLSPEYVETSGEPSQTQAFTITVQCYNYGEATETPAGTVNKLDGTQSWAKDDTGVWQKEKINKNQDIKPAEKKGDFAGEVSLGISNIINSAYELYAGGKKLEKIALAGGTGSISAVIKAEDGNIGDNHLFLIISASDGTGSGNGALMINPIIVSHHNSAGNYWKSSGELGWLRDWDWNEDNYNIWWDRLINGYCGANPDLPEAECPIDPYMGSMWCKGWIDKTWADVSPVSRCLFVGSVWVSYRAARLNLSAQKFTLYYNLSEDNIGYAPEEISKVWMKGGVSVWHEPNKIKYIGSIKNKTTGEIGTIKTIDEDHKYIIWQSLSGSDFGSSEQAYKFEPSIDTEGAEGAEQMKPEYCDWVPYSVSGIEISFPQIIFIPKSEE